MTDRIAALLQELDPATVRRGDPLSPRARSELAEFARLEAKRTTDEARAGRIQDLDVEDTTTAVSLVPRQRRMHQLVSVAAAAALLTTAGVIISSMWPDPRSTATPPPDSHTVDPIDPVFDHDLDGNGRPIDYTPIDTTAPSASLTLATVRSFDPDDGTTWDPLSISPEGDVLVRIQADGDFDVERWERTEAQRIGVLTDDGLEVFASTESLIADDKLRAIENAVITDNYYVWLETTADNYYGFDWRMFSRPRDGGPTTLIARSEDVCAPDSECSWAIALPMAANGDEVAWQAPARISDQLVQDAMLSISAAGGELTIEHAPAAEPVAVAGGWLAFRLSDESDVNNLSAGTDQRWLGIDRVMSPGSAERLVSFAKPATSTNWWVAHLKSDGNLAAWQSGTRLFVTSLDGNSAYGLNVGNLADSLGENIQICGGRVHWTTGPEEGPLQMLAFDPATEKVFTVDTPALTDGSFSCAGDFVVQKGTESSDQAVVVSRWGEIDPDSSRVEEPELPDTPLVADLRTALTELEAAPFDAWVLEDHFECIPVGSRFYYCPAYGWPSADGDIETLIDKATAEEVSDGAIPPSAVYTQELERIRGLSIEGQKEFLITDLTTAIWYAETVDSGTQ